MLKGVICELPIWFRDLLIEVDHDLPIDVHHNLPVGIYCNLLIGFLLMLETIIHECNGLCKVKTSK